MVAGGVLGSERWPSGRRQAETGKLGRAGWPHPTRWPRAEGPALASALAAPWG